MSRVSRIGVGAPHLATRSIARAICSVIVTSCGKAEYSTGQIGRVRA